MINSVEMSNLSAHTMVSKYWFSLKGAIVPWRSGTQKVQDEPGLFCNDQNAEIIVDCYDYIKRP